MSKSRFESLEDIKIRKQELRRQISRQEETLGQDFDAYQEEVDTVKRFWGYMVSFHKMGGKVRKEGLGAIKHLAGGATSAVSDGTKLSTAITVAGKILLWAWNRKKHKK